MKMLKLDFKMRDPEDRQKLHYIQRTSALIENREGEDSKGCCRGREVRAQQEGGAANGQQQVPLEAKQ